MEERITGKLMDSLRSNKDLDDILKKESENFVAQPLYVMLEEILKEKKLTRTQVIQNSMLNTIYAHQIFKGTRIPSRDKIIAIGFGMHLSFEEMDNLLKMQGYARLYPQNKRDAVIIYGILHNMHLMDVNTALYENELTTIA